MEVGVVQQQPSAVERVLCHRMQQQSLGFQMVQALRFGLLQGLRQVHVWPSKAANCSAASYACSASITSPKSPSMMANNL
jgi:hypothetical protein